MKKRPPDLLKQADTLLRRAGYDTATGAKKDRRYRRNKRAKREHFAPYWRGRTKSFGKIGPASPGRKINPESGAT